jgi:hypothetical protein
VYRYDPGGIAPRSPWFGGHIVDLLVHTRRRARPGRPGQLGPAHSREDADHANHAGHFSEEIALTGKQIGNFPQAVTHPALIDAGLTLNEALDTAQR